ncbi:MAG: S41 family peptidase [Ruminiclostridium sp.]|nr:S41 family peptidase [Ruminiclostridium sp.]
MRKRKLLSLGLAACLAVTSLAVPVTADDTAIPAIPAMPIITAPVVPAVKKHSFKAKTELADTFKSVKTKKTTFYNYTSDSTDEHYLYFFDGNNSVPYMELSQLFKLYKQASHSDMLDDYTLDVDCGYGKSKFYAFRENGTKVTFSFSPDTVIEFDDYDKFVSASKAVSGGDICLPNRWQLNEDGTVKTDEKGNALVKLIYTADSAATNFQRAGYSRTVHPGLYGIKLYIRNGKAYMPVATFSDLFLSTLQVGYVYNGKSVFLTSLGGLDTETKNADGKTAAELFADIGDTKRTKQLAEFVYNELVFVLEFGYGLAEEHNIYSFDKYFESIGLKKRLLSTDASEFDKALSELLEGYLGDLHSGFGSAGPYDTGTNDKTGFKMSDVLSPSISKTVISQALYMGGRLTGNNILDENKKVIPYKEVGDTAYLTFDVFLMMQNTDNYYTDKFRENVKDYIDKDLIALVHYADQRIKRKNSPIKNVVIDLTNNGGGAVDAAAFLVSWLIGYCEISTVNATTNAQYTVFYRADINLDGYVDQNDMLNPNSLSGGINVYCLTSPFSFSCGNLVPSVLKESGRATILGKTSGGGACAVQPAVTPDGTFYQYSGKFKLCNFNNGIYYQIDQGVTPDITLTKLEHFYDREWLTEFIHDLP